MLMLTRQKQGNCSLNRTRFFLRILLKLFVIFLLFRYSYPSSKMDNNIVSWWNRDLIVFRYARRKTYSISMALLFISSVKSVNRAINLDVISRVRATWNGCVRIMPFVFQNGLHHATERFYLWTNKAVDRYTSTSLFCTFFSFVFSFFLLSLSLFFFFILVFVFCFLFFVP